MAMNMRNTLPAWVQSNERDINMMNKMCRGIATYNDIENLINSIDKITGQKMYNFTIKDLIQYKMSIVNDITARVKITTGHIIESIFGQENEHKKISFIKDMGQFELSEEIKREESPFKLVIKQAYGNNDTFTIAKYLDMKPEHRCFCDSSSAHRIQYNEMNGKLSDNETYIKKMLKKLTSGMEIDSPVDLSKKITIYDKKWDKTDVCDIVMYDAFFVNKISGCKLMWDYDITYFYDLFKKREKINMKKFYYHSLTSKLYFMKTQHDIYHVKNLYEFEDLLIYLSKNEYKRKSHLLDNQDDEMVSSKKQKMSN